MEHISSGCKINHHWVRRVFKSKDTSWFVRWRVQRNCGENQQRCSRKILSKNLIQYQGKESSSLLKPILTNSNFILIVHITTGLINAFNILRYYLPWVDIFITYQIMTNTLACSHCKVDMNTTWFFILCIYISSHTLSFFWWWNQWYKDETMFQLFFYQFLCLQKPGNFDFYKL